MPDYTPTRFALEITARLRGIIAQYDINQADLATLCDVSQSQFSKIIRTVRPMSVDQFAAICEALAVDPVALVGEVEEFLADRPASVASPMRYVEEGERLAQPEPFDDDQLDAWATAAKARLAPSVGGTDDYALAASDDPDWESQQERENE